MDLDKIHQEAFTDEKPGPGKILIAHPFLKDLHFARAVILLCDHEGEGSFGFILNKRLVKNLDQLVPDVTQPKQPVYLGGPVQMDTLHFIHQSPDLIEDSFKITQDLYWGGDFERAIELLNIGLLDSTKIKFILGYAGWSKGQLEGELHEKSWIVSTPTSQLLFAEEDKEIWQKSLRHMGKDFAALANYPIDPSLN